MRVSLEGRIELTQRDDVFDGKIAGEAQTEVQRWSFMPTRPDNAIAVVPLGHVGIVIGDLEIQGGDNVHLGEAVVNWHVVFLLAGWRSSTAAYVPCLSGPMGGGLRRAGAHARGIRD